MENPLTLLLCGALSTEENEINEVLAHLASSIENATEEINSLDLLSDKKVSLYGPFLGRSVLELAATALIARLDPFRLLLLRERQKQPDFELDKPHKSSIRWQGDVMADKVSNLWDEKSLANPTRALLGDYYTKLIWLGSFTNLLDRSEEISGDEWLGDLRKKDSQRFCSEVRADFSSLYSELSKGIHHEIVIPAAAAFDKATTKELIRKVLYNVSTLGLIVSLIEHATNRPDMTAAFEAYRKVQKMEIFREH